MTRGNRALIAAGGLLLLVVATGFIAQAEWAASLWPVQTGRLDRIFIGSILAAIGAPALWLVLANEGRAIAAGAADLVVITGGQAAVAFASGLATFGVGMAAAAALFALLFWQWHREPFRDDRPMPRALRVALAVGALVLVYAAARLLLLVPNTFPWPLSPENSRFYAFVFVGAIVYFGYGLLWPVAGNARGQLIGFLVYDLVLLPPLVGHFARVKPEMMPSLIVYTTVVVVSGLVALWFLVVDPVVRLRARG